MRGEFFELLLWCEGLLDCGYFSDDFLYWVESKLLVGFDEFEGYFVDSLWLWVGVSFNKDEEGLHFGVFNKGLVYLYLVLWFGVEVLKESS